MLKSCVQRLQFLEEDEDEDDFDYSDVNLPEGAVVGKSYEDASLLEGLSADADKAFEREEERMLSQQPMLGFFGANFRTPQDQVHSWTVSSSKSHVVEANKFHPVSRLACL